MLADFKKLPIDDKIQLVISNLLRVSVIVALFFAVLHQRWTVLFVSSLALTLTFIPAFIERKFNVYLPTEFEFAIILFIYASIFLGEVHGYYTKLWWWDVVLHTGSGIALGLIAFLMLYVLYYEKKINASPFYIAFFTFFIALGVGGLWEIFEFGMDSVFGLNMQKSGLTDTMWDLIVDALGALFAAMIGYFYIIGRKTFLFNNLLLTFFKENPKYQKHQ